MTGWLIVIWKRRVSKHSWPSLRLSPAIYLDGPMKTTKTLRLVGVPGGIPNGHLQNISHKPEESLVKPTSTVYYYSKYCLINCILASEEHESSEIPLSLPIQCAKLTLSHRRAPVAYAPIITHHSPPAIWAHGISRLRLNAAF
jgi:hypothetical protein